MLVVVTGAAGQLGRALQLADPGHHRVRYLVRDDCDLTDAGAVTECSAFAGADVVLNCAAFTAVDAAEDEPGRAFADAANARAPELLSRRCAGEGAHLVQLSTDYVFGDWGRGDRGEEEQTGRATKASGTKRDAPCPSLRAPIPADATPHPLGVYGKSKLAGERAAMTGPAPATVVRTAWLYSGELVAQAKDFVSTMLRLAREGVDPQVVDDQFGSPTYAGDLARALWALCDALAAGPVPSGRILHGVGAGEASWFELAREVFRAAGHDPARVTPVPSSGYPTRARRPHWSVLEPDLDLPEWRSGVRRAVAGTL